MEKRHQITKIEKYEKEIKNCKVIQYLSVATLANGIALTSLNVPSESVKNGIQIILNSFIMALSVFNLKEAIVEKYHIQQKIDELKDQEENQSRSR